MKAGIGGFVGLIDGRVAVAKIGVAVKNGVSVAGGGVAVRVGVRVFVGKTNAAMVDVGPCRIADS